MDKFVKVFWYEYKKHVMRRRFLFALFSIPLFLVIVLGLSIGAQFINTDNRPIGYVDHSGLLADPLPPEKTSGLFTNDIEIQAFSDDASARAALDSGSIQGYYVVSVTYFQDGAVRLVSAEEPNWRVQERFDEFMRVNLLQTIPEPARSRLNEGITFTISSPDGGRQVGENQWLRLIMPLIAGIPLMIIVVTAGGYLLNSLVEEKENRTMEMLVTSVSPSQMMAGKTVGNLMVGITQLVVWVLFAVLAIFILQGRVDWADQLVLEPKYIFILLATLIPALILVAALMAAIGATVTEAREAQQVSGFLSLPFFIPYWFVSSIMSHPNSPLSLFLSFFPLTAPVTITMRAGFSDIPAWQLALNILVLFIAAAFAVWLAGRAFRLGMLSYGKRLKLRDLFVRG